jgi:hypothetical protein
MISGSGATLIKVEASLAEPKTVADMLSDTSEDVISSQGNVKFSVALDTITAGRGRLLNVTANISTLPKDTGKLETDI